MKKYNGFYLMGNYPDRDTFIQCALKGLEKFDFLEVGIPFSDPIADGKAIADAAGMMLEQGVSFSDIADSIIEIRQNIPEKKHIYLMTYANIIMNQNPDYLNSLSERTGIRGLIIPDMPFCEKNFFHDKGIKLNIPLIHFITPETEKNLLKKICSESENFIYFIARRGITGARTEIGTDTRDLLKEAKEHARCPVVLGFGIGDRASASEASEISDGFITGTALLEALNSGGPEGFSETVDSLFE